MRKLFGLAVLAALSAALVLAGAGCKKGPGGDAAGKVIKDSKTGEDISKPLTLPPGGAKIEQPSTKGAPSAPTGAPGEPTG